MHHIHFNLVSQHWHASDKVARHNIQNSDTQCLGNASATFKAAFANPHTYAFSDYHFCFR